VVVSLGPQRRQGTDTVVTSGVRYRTSAGFNVGALAVVLILVALYATWW
jgi:SSS family solute:Na+ symporter